MDKYRELTLTVSERMMEGLKEDFLALSRLQERTPMVVQFTLHGTVEIPGPDGTMHPVKVKKEVEIPNMEKKTELYQSWLNLSRMIKQVGENLREEEQQRSKEETEKRMFDSREKFIQPQEETL